MEETWQICQKRGIWIVIIAPLVFKQAVDEVNNKSSEVEINGFRGVYVFDIAQTDGDELPEFASVQGNPSEYQEKLTSFISANGITLEYSDTLVSRFMHPDCTIPQIQQSVSA